MIQSYYQLIQPYRILPFHPTILQNELIQVTSYINPTILPFDPNILPFNEVWSPGIVLYVLLLHKEPLLEFNLTL